MINKDRTFFQYNSRELVYIILLLTSYLQTALRKVMIKYCYVRQCSLFAYLIISFLYEMCLGGFHYNSLYALSLHSTLAHLWVPFLHMLGGIREQVHVIYNKLKLILHITQTKTYL